jgi:hypothetical protein
MRRWQRRTPRSRKWVITALASILAFVSATTIMPSRSSGCRVIVLAGSSSTRFFIFHSTDKFEMDDDMPPIHASLSTTVPEDAYAYMKESLYKVHIYIYDIFKSSAHVIYYYVVHRFCTELSRKNGQRATFTSTGRAVCVHFPKMPKSAYTRNYTETFMQIEE